MGQDDTGKAEGGQGRMDDSQGGRGTGSYPHKAAWRLRNVTGGAEGADGTALAALPTPAQVQDVQCPWGRVVVSQPGLCAQGGRTVSSATCAH